MALIDRLTCFTRADCGEKVSAGTVKNAEIDMLNALAGFCDEHGLRYYLSGGTLLGAIRHKGFIPWDDDIDVNLPRPDIDRLYELTGGKLGRYTLTRGGLEDPYSPSCQSYRIYDDEYIMENDHNGESDTFFYHPLFIDVIPIDGLPKDMKAMRIYCSVLKFMRGMIGVAWHDKIIAATPKARAMHIAAEIPAKLIGYKRWTRWFQRYARKYSYDQCDYVGVNVVTHYLPRERVVKSEYEPQIPVMFEGRQYWAPKGYDVYLRQLYGDYMTPPPENKRNSGHSFSIYKRAHHA